MIKKLLLALKVKGFTNNRLSLLFVPVLLCSTLAGCSNAATSTSSEITSGQGTTAVSMSGGGPILGVVVDEKLVVLGIEAGSAAERAGLQIGDQLETLNEVPFASEREKAKDLIHQFATNDHALPMKLVRSGQEITIDVTPGGIELPTNPTNNNKPPPTATPVWPPNDYF